jgi:hypothetical protein
VQHETLVEGEAMVSNRVYVARADTRRLSALLSAVACRAGTSPRNDLTCRLGRLWVGAGAGDDGAGGAGED